MSKHLENGYIIFEEFFFEWHKEQEYKRQKQKNVLRDIGIKNKLPVDFIIKSPFSHDIWKRILKQCTIK